MERRCPEKEQLGGGKCDALCYCEVCEKYLAPCPGCDLNMMPKSIKEAIEQIEKQPHDSTMHGKTHPVSLQPEIIL